MPRIVTNYRPIVQEYGKVKIEIFDISVNLS